RLRGVEFLEPGEMILSDELEAAERAAGLRLAPGDVLLLRTGRAVCKAERGVWNPRDRLAGMHVSCARWLRERDVAVVGCDGISDVIPAGVGDLSNPLHVLLLVAMGVHILDNQQLEGVARARWQPARGAAVSRVWTRWHSPPTLAPPWRGGRQWAASSSSSCAATSWTWRWPS